MPQGTELNVRILSWLTFQQDSWKYRLAGVPFQITYLFKIDARSKVSGLFLLNPWVLAKVSTKGHLDNATGRTAQNLCSFFVHAI